MSGRFIVVMRGAVLAAFLVALVPNVAEAKALLNWGWVTARKPTTANYTPAAKDQGNARGGTNTVQRVFPGRYTVTFQYLSATGCTNNGCLGTAVVTALSKSQRSCVVGDLSTATPVTVYVVCRDRNGNYADSAFSVSYLSQVVNSATLAYLYADQPSTSFYYPDPYYDYNSNEGKHEAVQRLGVGYYFVYLTDMYGGSRGNMQINGTYGSCKIEDRDDNLDPGDIYTAVYVRCRDFHGAAADNTFFLTYTENVGLEGTPGTAAYVFANRPTTSSYHPVAAFSYSSAGPAATIKRAAKGVYSVKLAGMPIGGGAQVTAYGTGTAQCQLSGIAGKYTPQRVGVLCFTPSGAPVDSQFYLTYTR